MKTKMMNNYCLPFLKVLKDGFDQDKVREGKARPGKARHYRPDKARQGKAARYNIKGPTRQGEAFKA